jgi:hypothetical protein
VSSSRWLSCRKLQSEGFTEAKRALLTPTLYFAVYIENNYENIYLGELVTRNESASDKIF